MPSERIQRQIDRLLDEAEQASAQQHWRQVGDLCRHVLTFDPANEDALALLAFCHRHEVVKQAISSLFTLSRT